MSHELEPLQLDATMMAWLPLGLRKIFVSHDILDAAALRTLTLALPRYRHRAIFVRHPLKPLSKVDP